MTDTFTNSRVKRLAHFWGGVHLFLGIWLFLAWLTPATPILVEFCWGKEGGVSYCHIFCYRKPFLTKFGWILGLFDLLEPMEQVSEPFEVIFRWFFFRESFKATRAILVLELFGGYVHPFLVIQKPRSAIFDLLSLMEEVSKPLEVIFTSKFSMQD